MNAEKEKALRERAQRNPFWVCFIVFVLLAADYGYRLVNLVEQHNQLDQARIMQAQNAGGLAQARQLEARLEALSLDLLQVARTNATAKQIVQDFNIQWTPGPTAAPAAPQPQPQTPAPANGSQPK
jgi:hypothetical protein